MKKFLGIIAVVAYSTPALAFAQNVTNLDNLIVKIKNLLNSLVPLFIAVAVVWFLYGLIKYVTTGESEEKGKARDYMIWGIVAIFVMTAVWGLVAVLANTLGLPTTGPVIPTLPQ